MQCFPNEGSEQVVESVFDNTPGPQGYTSQDIDAFIHGSSEGKIVARGNIGNPPKEGRWTTPIASQPPTYGHATNNGTRRLQKTNSGNGNSSGGMLGSFLLRVCISLGRF